MTKSVIIDFEFPVSYEPHLQQRYEDSDFNYFRMNNPSQMAHFAWYRYKVDKEYANYLKIKYPDLVFFND